MLKGPLGGALPPIVYAHVVVIVLDEKPEKTQVPVLRERALAQVGEGGQELPQVLVGGVIQFAGRLATDEVKAMRDFVDEHRVYLLFCQGRRNGAFQLANLAAQLAFVQTWHWS